MVAITAIIGAIMTLAGALGGKWFVALIGIFLIVVPFGAGALILGDIPWWVLFGGIVIFIYLMSQGGKRK